MSNTRQERLLRLYPTVYREQDDRERQSIAFITRLEVYIRLCNANME